MVIGHRWALGVTGQVTGVQKPRSAGGPPLVSRDAKSHARSRGGAWAQHSHDVIDKTPHSIASGLDVTGPSYQRNDGQLRSMTADPRAAAHLERTSSTEYPFLDASLTRPGDGVDAGRSASCHS